MFFTDRNGNKRPVSRIERWRHIHPNPDFGSKEEYITVEVVGSDETLKAEPAEFYEALMMTPQASYPASPGTYVLDHNHGLDDFRIYKSAVIGWMLPAWSEARAVTMKGFNNGEGVDRFLTILHPTGFVEDGEGDNTFDSIDEWADWIKNNLHKEAEARAQRGA